MLKAGLKPKFRDPTSKHFSDPKSYYEMGWEPKEEGFIRFGLRELKTEMSTIFEALGWELWAK